MGHLTLICHHCRKRFPFLSERISFTTTMNHSGGSSSLPPCPTSCSPTSTANAALSPSTVLFSLRGHHASSATPGRSSTTVTRISPRQSPFSPFPFGSPIVHSDRSVLTPGFRRVVGGGEGDMSALGRSEMSPATTANTSSRLRGRDIYGGNKKRHRYSFL